MSEAEISMILNTYMYLDYKEAGNGMYLYEIVEDLSQMKDCNPGGIHYEEFQILQEAVDNPEVGELQIGNQSHLLGYDSGTWACTFTGKEKETYIVYRGTGDGEWPDNGLGMTKESTIQQERALSYFEEVIEKEQIMQEERVIVTGHSKGGNKAQYVTMATKYEEFLDACYSIDGQGFSENAIESWKETYGEEAYLSRTGKITGIYGENDYVHVLGTSIVPKEQIYYVKTPVEKENFAGYHDIKYMFASMEKDVVTGEVVYFFHGKSNPYVAERGRLAEYGAQLSDRMMQLPEDEREGCAAVIMQLMEASGGKTEGLNGEKLSLFDLYNFQKAGLPMIEESLLKSNAGLLFLDSALFGTTFLGELMGTVNVMLNEPMMREQIQMLYDLLKKLKDYQREVEEIEKELPIVISSYLLLTYQVKKQRKQLQKAIIELEKLYKALLLIIEAYAKQDEESAENMGFVCRE